MHYLFTESETGTVGDVAVAETEQENESSASGELTKRGIFHFVFQCLILGTLQNLLSFMAGGEENLQVIHRWYHKTAIVHGDAAG